MQVLLDETVMAPGQLEATGVAALRALKHLMKAKVPAELERRHSLHCSRRVSSDLYACDSRDSQGVAHHPIATRECDHLD